MILENVLYIILAILGLSVLVFVHEFGHYLMAKKVGMRIETFSIGFGKPIISWHKKNIKWQICWLPFGGFVKIAGMQKEGNLEPHEIKDGFFGKKPVDRIKVAIMGPFVNLVFAFLIFSFIWALGGRNKPFSDFTNKIGYVDPKSVLYDHSVRPGDEIVEYNKKKYLGFKDILYNSVLDGKQIEIKGYNINYFNNKKIPFEYVLKTYQNNQTGKDFSTIGIYAPASYLIFDKKLNEGIFSPIIKSSEIQNNDRILWVNGEIIFSNLHLKSLINENSVFLTFQRDNKIFHSKINLLKLADLKVLSNFENQIDDWKYLERIKTNVKDLNIIPYTFNEDAIIKNPLIYIDETDYKFPNSRNMYNVPLKKGDKIIAVGGVKIKKASQLLKALQNPNILVMAQKDPNILNKIAYKDADQNFNENLNINDINKIAATIGTNKEITSSSNLKLLRPIHPITNQEMAKVSPLFEKGFTETKMQIEKIKDIEKKEEALKSFEKMSKEKILGLNLVNRLVKYNPNPFKMFSDVFSEVFKTFIALISGYLSPKHLAGPISIVHIVKTSWSLGYLEAFYWIAFISLNLGFFNLLPIPVLDGGHIIFSLVEMITKKPIKVKTMEKLIIPFVVLLIGFFIFMTYNDILRIINQFF